MLWIRVGDAGGYHSFDDLTDVIDDLNGLRVGRVDHWIDSGPGVGFATPNYHGYDFISCYWGDADANLTRALNQAERREVEAGLVEVYI